MEEQRHLADLLNDYERRAQERRDVLMNSSSLQQFPFDHTTDIRVILPIAPVESPENFVVDNNTLPRYVSQGLL